MELTVKSPSPGNITVRGEDFEIYGDEVWYIEERDVVYVHSNKKTIAVFNDVFMVRFGAVGLTRVRKDNVLIMIPT